MDITTAASSDKVMNENPMSPSRGETKMPVELDNQQLSENGRGGASPRSSRRYFQKPFSFYMSFVSLQLLAVITSWDSTALAIALPTITDRLAGTTLESFWASIAFTLGVVVIQPIYVSVSDVLGRSYPLYVSMALFAVGAIVFATAHTMTAVIAGRLVQGLGAGGIDVLEEIILADITTLKERPVYLGLLAVAIAAGSITGPIVGAVFAEYVDWRWIGWINLPIVGVAFTLAVVFLRLRPIELSLSVKMRRLDWGGIGLFTVGATACALPLSWAGSLYPWSSWRTILPLIIGVLVLVVFGLYEKHPVQPVMPYRLFANRTAVLSQITSGIQGLVMYTMLLYLPLFFEAVFLQEPFRAAITILPVCCLVVASSVAAPVIIELTRRYRVLLWTGWVLTTTFLGLWCLVNRTTARAEIYGLQVALGAGVGLVFTGTQVPVQASVGRVDDTGLAIGLMVVLRWCGALLGQTVGATVFASIFRQHVSKLNNLPASAAPLRDADQAIGFIHQLRSLDLDAGFIDEIVAVYTVSFRAVFVVVTCIAGVGFVLSLFIQEYSLEGEEVGRQGLVVEE